MRIVAVLLMSYGPDLNELFRQAAVHVDEILNDMRPEELPVAATDTLRALRRRADSPSARRRRARSVSVAATGSSSGLMSFRISSTWTAACRNSSLRSGP